MKKLLCIILSLVLCFSTLAFLGCSRKKVITFTAFNTVVRIQSNDKYISNETERKITELFSSLEKEFSTKFASSTINAFNNADKDVSISVSKRFVEVFEKCKALYQFTDGAFNPCIMPLVEAWGFSNYPILNFAPPSIEQISNALALCDFDSVNLANRTLTKTKSGVKLDFGGILKGYAVDLALKILKDAGHKNGYISVGNSSLALLNTDSLSVTHPRPHQNKNTIISIKTKNQNYLTLSTSGDYERFYIYNDVSYSHIIDSKTGYPVNTGVASATLLGVNGTESDALTTALCATTHNPTDFASSDLIKFLTKITSTYPKAQFYVVYDKDGVKQLITNKKQGENFTLLDTEYTVKNI